MQTCLHHSEDNSRGRADAGRAVVGRVVAHGREDAPAKVDAAHPAVVVVVALVGNVAALLDHFPVQAEDVDRAVVAARRTNTRASGLVDTAFLMGCQTNLNLAPSNIHTTGVLY